MTYQKFNEIFEGDEFAPIARKRRRRTAPALGLDLDEEPARIPT